MERVLGQYPAAKFQRDTARWIYASHIHKDLLRVHQLL